WEVTKLENLAKIPLPLRKKPERGAPDSYIKVREQARLQYEFRTTGKPVHELLPQQDGCGLARLPEPCPGDVFLDFEADPFVEEGGLEYLLGFVALNDAGEHEYTPMWAFDRKTERGMFESFIDLVMERRSQFPGLHIYHFSQYETTALKRLMGRYATREDEIDRLLRAGVFVDLYGITKQSLRASVESYSLKDLEVFFGFQRKTDLRDARTSLRNLECALELNQVETIPPDVLATVQAYNREDCVSTFHLRNWLEEIRRDLITGGHEIARPILQDESPTEAIKERRKRALELMARLLKGIPDEQKDRTSEQQAQWLLAHLLEWHRREEKAPWWEYFRLKALTDEERLDEHYAVSGLEFVKRLDSGTARCPIDRYRFPAQNMQIRPDDKLETSDGAFGTVVTIDYAERTIDVKKKGAMADDHPKSVFAHTVVGAPEQAESLYRLGAWVADHGIDSCGQYRAARDLLLGNAPRVRPDSPTPLYDPLLDITTEAKRLSLQMDNGVLPIQGPPGAGKTYTAARMICGLLREGKKVGITAVSHKVIRKLLEEVLTAAQETQVSV
ncbi:MAG TPA: TM0106 family RecB-like putative nuclease, partial [Terriglobia bacterium]|nr:TM0106 family RecB-like putative nuclease [Terriglobia bacterium]